MGNSGGTAGARLSSRRRPGTKALFRTRWETAMAKTDRKPDHGAEELYALRHSAAHVMAGPAPPLFPPAQVGFGPPPPRRLFYDLQPPPPITHGDLPHIEESMRATGWR